ncbi:hypothetical protein [Bradyrhizobium sp. CCBAU 53338]|nr:hypothetical protein [Bradyrhizobium sp. CCBAU 53338]
MIVVTQRMAVVPGAFVVDIKSRLVRWRAAAFNRQDRQSRQAA